MIDIPTIIYDDVSVVIHYYIPTTVYDIYISSNTL